MDISEQEKNRIRGLHKSNSIIKEQVEEATAKTIVDKLIEILDTWETKQYPSDEARWKAYYEDIEVVVDKYEDVEFEFDGMPILQDPGNTGTPSIEYQLANPDSLETM